MMRNKGSIGVDDYLERLTQIRDELNMSLEACADKLNMSENFLRMIELGEMTPTENMKAAIMEFILDHI